MAHGNGAAAVLVILCTLACLLPVGGCVSNRQFNTEPSQYLSTLESPSDVQVGVDLAVIEFDEFGMFWDRNQLEDALSRIAERNAESTKGIGVFLYVHGWQNNADPTRTENDLARFRLALQHLASDFSQRADTTPDHIVGVYIGWRGATTRLPLMNLMTFWDRRRAAERVAGSNLREAFGRITYASKEHPDSKVLITGHSMGGMIIGLTLGPTIETLLMAHGELGFRSPTDGVHLLNPALDAMATVQLVDLMKRRGVVAELRYADGRVEPAPGPVLVSITSEADWVTKDAYRLGQWVDRLSIDKRPLNMDGWPSQSELASHATGHLPFLASHRAFIREGEVVIEPIPGAWNDTPYWIVSVSSEIGKDHGDIDNARFNEVREQLLFKNRIYDTRVQTWLRTTQ